MPTIAEIARAIDPAAFDPESMEIARDYGEFHWILDRQERARAAAERVMALLAR
jgi:hypothetical protein